MSTDSPMRTVIHTKVNHRATYVHVITGSVDGVETLSDWDTAIQSLVHEGVPENAVRVYGGSAAFSATIDNSGALRALLDTLEEYLEERLDEEERGGYDPTTERALIMAIRKIGEGL